MATPLPIRAKITPLGNKFGLIEIQLHGWRGWIPSLQATPDRYRRIGESGSGSQSTGLQGPRVTCTGLRAESSVAAMIATIAAVELLPNEVVRILDAWGRTIPRCRIYEVTANPVRGKGPIITGSTAATHRVEISISVERLPDA